MILIAHYRLDVIYRLCWLL